MRWAVWKFPTALDDLAGVLNLTLPLGARVLSVASQNEALAVYALVNPDEKRTESRTLYVLGTGHVREDVPADAAFLGTVMFLSGRLVFHVWG